jgi:hypothetical protein
MFAVSLLRPTFVDIGQFLFKLGNPTVSKLNLPIRQGQLMVLGVKLAHQPRQSIQTLHKGMFVGHKN